MYISLEVKLFPSRCANFGGDMFVSRVDTSHLPIPLSLSSWTLSFWHGIHGYSNYIN